MINFILAKKYRITPDELAKPLQKWTELVNYSRVRGASDVTRLGAVYLGMGRNEFFSSVSHKDVSMAMKYPGICIFLIIIFQTINPTRGLTSSRTTHLQASVSGN